MVLRIFQAFAHSFGSDEPPAQNPQLPRWKQLLVTVILVLSQLIDNAL